MFFHRVEYEGSKAWGENVEFCMGASSEWGSEGRGGVLLTENLTPAGGRSVETARCAGPTA